MFDLFKKKTTLDVEMPMPPKPPKDQNLSWDIPDHVEGLQEQKEVYLSDDPELNAIEHAIEQIGEPEKQKEGFLTPEPEKNEQFALSDLAVQQPEQSFEQPAEPDLDQLPEFDTVPITAQPKKEMNEFNMFIDIRDYGKVFRDIKNINALTQKSFTTVLRIKDISGNMNKLYQKYHDDLAFINDRLTYMDTTLFER
ncbi:hypothetical protein C4573_04710 [Candidatus Woesearchaeota archaeon]|nr:MAG: hypothetical protein C4573_04710 [Candidatus Woesearchaeota archaeon]